LLASKYITCKGLPLLRNYISQFLDYCTNSNFSTRSIESLEFRLHEFNTFIQQQAIPAIGHITYQHLILFVADYGALSPSVKKMRVWSLHQFFHYLTLQQLIPHRSICGKPMRLIEIVGRGGFDVQKPMRESAEKPP